MPRFRKLNAAEIPANVPTLSARAQLAQAYDALLADFALGAYGRAELIDGEQRDSVCSRLHAAARRRGLALRFRPGRGPLIFRVEALPVVDAVLVAAVADVTSMPDRVPTQRAITSRRRPEERRPAGRYDDVLPRWMREGQPTGRRGESKRRQGQ